MTNETQSLLLAKGICSYIKWLRESSSIKADQPFDYNLKYVTE